MSPPSGPSWRSSGKNGRASGLTDGRRGVAETVARQERHDLFRRHPVQGGLRVVRNAFHEGGRELRVRARRREVHGLERVPLRVVDRSVGLELLVSGQSRNSRLDEGEAVGAVPDRVETEEAAPGLARRKGALEKGAKLLLPPVQVETLRPRGPEVVHDREDVGPQLSRMRADVCPRPETLLLLSREEDEAQRPARRARD